MNMQINIHEYANEIIIIYDHKIKRIWQPASMMIENMQQWWFGDGLGLKLVIYGVFFMISLIFKASLIFMYRQIR